MGFVIEDGKGSGISAGVSGTNRLLTTSISASPEHAANHNDGEAYSLLFDATPAGAGDCFFYMKNTGEKDIIVEGFYFHLEANEYVDVKLNDSGTPVGGGSITPVNLNTGSGNTATGTFQDGNDITGLSGGSTVYRIYHASAQSSTYHNFEQDLIIKKNGVLTFYIETGTAALDGVIDFYVKKADY